MRKNETKTYVIKYIKELIKSLTREDGTVDAEILLAAINKAFPNEVTYTEIKDPEE